MARKAKRIGGRMSRTKDKRITGEGLVYFYRDRRNRPHWKRVTGNVKIVDCAPEEADRIMERLREATDKNRG